MKEQIALENISRETCVVRETNKSKGRNISVTPKNTATKFLHYGRIILEAGDEPLSFENETHETGLICLNGSGKVSTGGAVFEVNRYDSLYIPRDSRIEITPGAEGCDFAEVSAEVEKRYPLQFVAFEEIRQDPALHFIAGKPPTERDLNILLGKNVAAGRIMAGVTFSSEGNWTSFPPHEHAELLEEAYLYIDMPAPQWGIQMVYTNPQDPELIEVVREGDVIVMPKGYHPNVAAPGGSINFLWMMAANREGVDRKFGVVNVQPEYAQGGSGLEASQK
ncbi:MAG TPA: 5-deoxy-glucuronate isomerase [Pyrinomonadaceae bacterium]|nr:5-deoxy-glucuronate isomerase [Pyrinomonadaceae bacterium]